MNRLIVKLMFLVFFINSSGNNPFACCAVDCFNEDVLKKIEANNGCCTTTCKGVFVVAPPLVTTLSSAADVVLTSLAVHFWDTDHHTREDLLTATCWCAFASYLAHSISHYEPAAEIYKKLQAGDIGGARSGVVNLTGRTFLTIILFADVFASMAGESLLKVIEKECEIASLVCSCVVFGYSVYHLVHAIRHCSSHHAGDYNEMRPVVTVGGINTSI